VKNAIIVSYDSKHKPHFTDLLSNLNLFKQKYDEADLKKLPKWKDNSDYSNYLSIEEVVANFNPETDNNKTFVCRVKDHQIWTSDSTLGGYDRAKETNDSKCRENLNQILYGSDEPKGFNDDDAGTLNFYVRYYKDKHGVYHLYLTKNMGNHRLWMKLLVWAGLPVEVLAKVKFHIIEDDLSQSDFITIESDAHHSDAGDRQSQNEPQKFHSGYRAKRKELVNCFNFLYQNQLNYKGIMQLENVEGSDSWPSLSSVMGFKDGDGNGIFKKYGVTNVTCAVKVAKLIAKKITKENEIQNSAIHCFATMFKSLTESYSNGTTNQPALFTKQELQEFFFEYFTEQNTSSKFRRRKLELGDLSQSGDIKSFNYICADIFWKDGAIVEYLRNIRGRQNGFTPNHPCMTHFLTQITPLIRKQALSLVTV
jgi:hypothetical protein